MSEFPNHVQQESTGRVYAMVRGLIGAIRVNPVEDPGVAYDMAMAERPHRERISELQAKLPKGFLMRFLRAEETNYLRAEIATEAYAASRDSEIVRAQAVMDNPELDEVLYEYPDII